MLHVTNHISTCWRLKLGIPLLVLSCTMMFSKVQCMIQVFQMSLMNSSFSLLAEQMCAVLARGVQWEGVWQNKSAQLVRIFNSWLYTAGIPCLKRRIKRRGEKGVPLPLPGNWTHHGQIILQCLLCFKELKCSFFGGMLGDILLVCNTLYTYMQNI